MLSGMAGAVGAVGVDVTVCAVGVGEVGFGVGAIRCLVGVVAQPVFVQHLPDARGDDANVSLLVEDLPNVEEGRCHVDAVALFVASNA